MAHLLQDLGVRAGGRTSDKTGQCPAKTNHLIEISRPPLSAM